MKNYEIVMILVLVLILVASYFIPERENDFGVKSYQVIDNREISQIEDVEIVEEQDILKSTKEKIKICLENDNCKNELLEPQIKEICDELGDKCFFEAEKRQQKGFCIYIKDKDLQKKCNAENTILISPGGSI